MRALAFLSGALMLLSSSFLSHAEDLTSPDLVGHWEGTQVGTKGYSHRLTIDVSRGDDGVLTAEITMHAGSGPIGYRSMVTPGAKVIMTDPVSGRSDICHFATQAGEPGLFCSYGFGGHQWGSSSVTKVVDLIS